MPSSSLNRLQAAHDAIVVPAAPMQRIRQRARASKPGIRKRLAFAFVGSLGLIGIAAAAQTFVTSRVFVSANQALVLRLDSHHDRPSQWVHNPSPDQLIAAARAANFRVTLPSGLPPGTIVRQLGVPSPDIIMLSYDLPGAARADNHMFWLILANRKSIIIGTQSVGRLTPGTLGLMLGGQAAKGNTLWRIRDEIVVVPSSTIAPSELAAIKRSMLADASRPLGVSHASSR